MSIRYKELRTDIDKKQGDIAQILNVKVNTYSKWENAINDMPIEKANILANYYNVSLDYLLGLSSSKKLNLINNSINWNVFKERIFDIRKSKKISQTELSKKLGFPQTTYSHYEIGDRKPTTLKALVIAQYYKVSMDYLFGRINDKKIK